MFNANDISFAQERLRNLKAQAEQARMIGQSRRINIPFWVRALSRILDQSRWTLVEKSDPARGTTAGIPYRKRLT